jgi:hypothetical protein
LVLYLGEGDHDVGLNVFAVAVFVVFAVFDIDIDQFAVWLVFSLFSVGASTSV